MSQCAAVREPSATASSFQCGQLGSATALKRRLCAYKLQAASHQWLDPATLNHWQSSQRDFYNKLPGYFPMYPTLPQGLPRYSTIFPEDRVQTCQRHPGSWASSKRQTKSQAQEASNPEGASRQTLNKQQDTSPGVPGHK